MAADSILNQPLTGSRILVLVSRGQERERLRIILGNAGADVHCAATAQEAFDAFQADPPHAFVGEVDEPEADYRLIRRLRTLSCGLDVPAVAISSLPWEEHRARAIEAGFSQWISKPATHALVEVIAALLDGGSRGRPGGTVPHTALPLLTDLSVTPIAETIRRLWTERRSGDLLVRTRKATRMVFFDGGRLVFAASNVRAERLGEALLNQGAISPEDFGRASRLMAREKVRFGDALVVAGVMKTGEVTRSVSRWVERIVLPLFDVRNGSAFFEHRACPIPSEYMVDVPVDRILHRGIRTMTRSETILSVLGRLDRRVTFSAMPEFPIETEDMDIVHLAKAPVTLRRLAWTQYGLTLERLRAVYALLATGVLADPNAPMVKPPASASWTNPGGRPAPTDTGKLRSRGIALDTIHRLLE